MSRGYKCVKGRAASFGLPLQSPSRQHTLFRLKLKKNGHRAAHRLCSKRQSALHQRFELCKLPLLGHVLSLIECSHTRCSFICPCTSVLLHLGCSSQVPTKLLRDVVHSCTRSSATRSLQFGSHPSVDRQHVRLSCFRSLALFGAGSSETTQSHQESPPLVFAIALFGAEFIRTDAACLHRTSLAVASRATMELERAVKKNPKSSTCRHNNL